mmetsp:Transcript_82961/g.248522  ORF Transcript_82961/g.248522 Transcript_82961/m.248522 type:complete len:155 (+) Transcript_82961:251-715(+)
MMEHFPESRIRSAADAEDALIVYRSTLAAAPAASVVLVSIGHMTNLLPLLQSGPDEWSPLSGLELVKRAVRHMVMMGGRRSYPEDANQQEWNFGGCGFSNFCTRSSGHLTRGPASPEYDSVQQCAIMHPHMRAPSPAARREQGAATTTISARLR